MFLFSHNFLYTCISIFGTHLLYIPIFTNATTAHTKEETEQLEKVGDESVGLNKCISNQFIQCNTIFNHTNTRIRTEARAYQVLLLYNILTKCRRQ